MLTPSTKSARRVKRVKIALFRLFERDYWEPVVTAAVSGDLDRHQSIISCRKPPANQTSPEGDININTS
ncbi:hypothetical protein J6590_084093 [Homalodisca vitripennis]|nr:hypothetical protein J6590_084093 [Homalodisca vitripennis]